MSLDPIGTGEQQDRVTDGDDIGSGWAAYGDDSKQVCYYHTKTGETKQDQPGGGGDEGWETFSTMVTFLCKPNF